MLVYSDSTIIDLEWLPKLNLGDYTVSHSFEEYRDTTADTKIAFTMHRLHCDHDINCAAYQGFEDKINKLSNISNLVFSFESEYIISTGRYGINATTITSTGLYPGK